MKACIRIEARVAVNFHVLHTRGARLGWRPKAVSLKKKGQGDS